MSVAPHSAPSEGRLAHFPISFFAVVMGLSGFAISWHAIGWPLTETICWIWNALASGVFIVVSALYLTKILRYPAHVIAELHHPVKLNFFPAFSISLLLLSILWKSVPALSLGLWTAGAVVQIVLTLYVMRSWIHKPHYTMDHVNPSWFIPVVGNIIAPITGSHLGFMEISWFFFSIGLLFWLVLFTVVLYRLFFHEPLTPKLTPMLFILLAPPSIGFVAYTSMVGELDIFARVLYYSAVFIALVLLTSASTFIRLPFFLSSWAYSFPFAALTIATIKMGHLHGHTIFVLLGSGLIVLLTALIALLLGLTLRAMARGQICVPE